MDQEAARRITYSEFENEVRQHDPRVLLSVTAAQSSTMVEFQGFQPEWKALAPWAITGIARASIEMSNRHRAKPLDEARLNELVFRYEEAEEYDRDAFEATPFLLGKAHQQFSYQLSAKEDLTRGLSLFLDTPIKYPNAKAADDWAQLLNAPLRDAALATVSLYSVVRQNKGFIRPEQRWSSYWSGLKHLVSTSSIMNTLHRLTATVEEARQEALTVPRLRDGLHKFGYNALIKTPFIDLENGLICAPQTQLVLRNFTADNLYYLGAKAWPDFPTEFGYRVEAYTGAQLQYTGELDVLPEIQWNKGGHQLSVDWFLITPAATILIECKSARMTLGARAGDTASVATIGQKLSPAYHQLNRTAQEIRSGNSAFAKIPKDRPLIGLVVTAEPCYLANTPEIRKALPKTELPVLTISLREIEHLAPLPAESIGEALVAITQDQRLYEYDLHSSLGEGLGGVDITKVRNKLTDDAYVRYIMPETMQKSLGLTSTED